MNLCEPIQVVEMAHQDYLEVYLAEWVTFMHSGRYCAGYPRRAIGISTGGNSKSFDELMEPVESEIVHAIDAAIESLPPAQRCAIHHCYLHSVYRFRENYPYIKALGDAKDGIRRAISRHVSLGLAL